MDKGNGASWGPSGQSQGEDPEARPGHDPYGTPPYGQPLLHI